MPVRLTTTHFPETSEAVNTFRLRISHILGKLRQVPKRPDLIYRGSLQDYEAWADFPVWEGLLARQVPG